MRLGLALCIVECYSYLQNPTTLRAHGGRQSKLPNEQ